MAFAEQPDLAVFQINIVKIHSYQLGQTHPTIQEQHNHAVISFWKIALCLRAFQKFNGLFRCQVFGQNFILLGWMDGGCGVRIQPVDLIDQIIIKAVQTGQPPGGRRFFVAAFTVQKIQIFINIFFCDRCPECGIQTFRVDVLHFAVIRNKAAAALHKTAEAAQVTVITECRIGAFARDHFQIADIFYDIL